MSQSNWKWVEPHPLSMPDEIYEHYYSSPIIANALINRGISTFEQASSFFNPKLYKQSPLTEFQDITKATQRIHRAIKKNELIGIWGDFDVDGQTATALLVTCLRTVGARVTHHIPIRADEGHGISSVGLETLLKNGVGLVITCDTGITAHEAVNLANKHKVDVIITDHHSLPDQLPSALAIINPNLLPDNHPLHALSGVGTAYQLARALYQNTQFENDINCLLDLVSLGTVADLAKLNPENRFLVQLGLAELRQNKRIGLQELFNLTKFNPTHLSEEHISFLIAPRMNAIGRLSDANVMVEFLTSPDRHRVKNIAMELEALNGQRQLAVDQIYKSALLQIEKNPMVLEEPVIVLSQTGWEAGVIGIVASRLVERFQKPAILLSIDQNRIARGSARSITGVNITQAISEQNEFLLSFGGHPMAAGLALQFQFLKQFTRGLRRSISRIQPDISMEKELKIDNYFPVTNMDSETVKNIELFAPFGNGNPAIILACHNLGIIEKTTIGKSNEHLKILVEDQDGKSAELIFWQGASEELPTDRFDLAYTARASNYEGGKGIQLEWIATRPASDGMLLSQGKTKYKIRDFRKVTETSQLIEITDKYPEIVIWAESMENPPNNFYHRWQLSSCKTLAIGVVPPDQDVLSIALKRSQPEEILLFGILAGMDNPKYFLNRLSGILRYAINKKDGFVNLGELAALTAQTEKCVKIGIDYLISIGSISLSDLKNESIKINLGGSPDKRKSILLLKDLKEVLKESASFRNYFLRAEPDSILQ